MRGQGRGRSISRLQLRRIPKCNGAYWYPFSVSSQQDSFIRAGHCNGTLHHEFLHRAPQGKFFSRGFVYLPKYHFLLWSETAGVASCGVLSALEESGSFGPRRCDGNPLLTHAYRVANDTNSQRSVCANAELPWRVARISCGVG